MRNNPRNKKKKQHAGAKPAKKPVHAEADTSLLIGRKALIELARYNPKAILKVHFAERGKPDAELTAALVGLESAGVTIVRTSADEIESLAPEENHQGLVAQIRPKQAQALEELIKRSLSRRGLLLALDEVNDVGNFGSILRTADAAGVDGIILPRAHSVALTPAVRKVSAGAAEFVPISIVSNLNQALQKLKDNGFWLAGTWLGENSTSLYETDLPAPLVIILGSEQRGLRELTRATCDFLIQIPMEGRVQSLNVAQAASIVLFEMLRRRGPSLGGKP